MAKGMRAFVRGFLFKVGIVHHQRVTAQMRVAYLAPHPTWSSRTAILVFPREIPAGPAGRVSDFLAGVHKGLMALKDRPVLVAWAMKDPAFTPEYLDRL